MAKKKKRAAPQKACVKCGKMNHARKLACDHCGTTQKARKRLAKKRAVKTPVRKKKTLSVGLGEIESAGDFISSVGGVAKAKQAMSAAEELAKKFS